MDPTGHYQPGQGKPMENAEAESLWSAVGPRSLQTAEHYPGAVGYEEAQHQHEAIVPPPAEKVEPQGKGKAVEVWLDHSHPEMEQWTKPASPQESEQEIQPGFTFSGLKLYPAPPLGPSYDGFATEPPPGVGMEFDPENLSDMDLDDSSIDSDLRYKAQLHFQAKLDKYYEEKGLREPTSAATDSHPANPNPALGTIEQQPPQDEMLSHRYILNATHGEPSSYYRPTYDQGYKHAEDKGNSEHGQVVPGMVVSPSETTTETAGLVMYSSPGQASEDVSQGGGVFPLRSGFIQSIGAEQPWAHDAAKGAAEPVPVSVKEAMEHQAHEAAWKAHMMKVTGGTGRFPLQPGLRSGGEVSEGSSQRLATRRPVASPEEPRLSGFYQPSSVENFGVSAYSPMTEPFPPYVDLIAEEERRNSRGSTEATGPPNKRKRADTC